MSRQEGGIILGYNGADEVLPLTKVFQMQSQFATSKQDSGYPKMVSIKGEKFNE